MTIDFKTLDKANSGIKVLKLNLTHTNPQLVPLYIVDSQTSYVDNSLEKIKNYAPSVAAGISYIYKALTGEILETEKLVVAQYKSGAFNKAFGPGVYRNAQTNELYLDFGNDKPVAISLVKSKGVSFPSAEEGADLEATFQMVNPFDTGEDLYLKLELTLEEKAVAIIFYALVRRASFDDEIDPDAVGNLVKRFPDNFKALVGTAPTGTKFDGELLKLSDLEINVDYQVVGYRAVETSYGTSYIMRVAAHESVNELTNGKEFEVWTNSPLKAVFGANPVATPEAPAKLVVTDKRTNKQGKVVVGASVIPQSYQTSEVFNDFALDFPF